MTTLEHAFQLATALPRAADYKRAALIDERRHQLTAVLRSMLQYPRLEVARRAEIMASVV